MCVNRGWRGLRIAVERRPCGSPASHPPVEAAATPACVAASTPCPFPPADCRDRAACLRCLDWQPSTRQSSLCWGCEVRPHALSSGPAAGASAAGASAACAAVLAQSTLQGNAASARTRGASIAAAAWTCCGSAGCRALHAAGGPFETRKRRLVPWLLYVEIALWVLLLGFTSEPAAWLPPRGGRLPTQLFQAGLPACLPATCAALTALSAAACRLPAPPPHRASLLSAAVYATVITYSPKVQNSCWTNNPCQYNADLFPVSCRDKSGNGERAARAGPACAEPPAPLPS